MEGVSTVMLFMVILVFLGTREALAKTHDVTWDTSTDLNSWASKQTFKVGDQLVFKYASGLHSVLELSGEKEYKNCDIGNAVDSKNGGNDMIKLTKPGTRYFACGTSGHCDQGMKLKIKTVAANEAASPSDDNQGSSSTPSSSDNQDSTTPSAKSTPASTNSAAVGIHQCSTVASFVLVFASFILVLVSMV